MARADSACVGICWTAPDSLHPLSTLSSISGFLNLLSSEPNGFSFFILCFYFATMTKYKLKYNGKKPHFLPEPVEGELPYLILPEFFSSYSLHPRPRQASPAWSGSASPATAHPRGCPPPPVWVMAPQAGCPMLSLESKESSGVDHLSSWKLKAPPSPTQQHIRTVSLPFSKTARVPLTLLHTHHGTLPPFGMF